ncbi:MAG: universal stress protein [Candidatus Methylumidiphilus sp.]
MNVLIALDLSENAAGVLDKTVGLLQGALGKVWLLHVAAPAPDFVGYEVDPEVMRQQVAEGYHREHRQLQAMAENLRARGLDATALLVQGETAKTIVQEAEKLGADMIVAGTRRHGVWRRLLLGEVDGDGLSAAGKPVLLVPVL